jgi:hypothetical protein
MINAEGTPLWTPSFQPAAKLVKDWLLLFKEAYNHLKLVRNIGYLEYEPELLRPVVLRNVESVLRRLILIKGLETLGMLRGLWWLSVQLFSSLRYLIGVMESAQHSIRLPHLSPQCPSINAEKIRKSHILLIKHTHGRFSYYG